MYSDHLRLTGKRIVDFLLLLIELFSLGVIQLRHCERILVQNQRFRSNGGRMTRNSDSRQIFLPFCHNPRVWQTERRTDWQTPFSSLVCAGIPCSAEKCVTSVYDYRARYSIYQDFFFIWQINSILNAAKFKYSWHKLKETSSQTHNVTRRTV